MNITAIIPARMGSTRFPGKPMELINGTPMIEHVYRRVSQSTNVSQVVVATCDDVILKHIQSIGGKAVMTSTAHERASDRCAEALLILEKEAGCKFDVVVMVQGDEPMIHPEMVDEAVDGLLTSGCQVANLKAKIKSYDEFVDPNCIKVVTDHEGFALYFSRQPIPTVSESHFREAGKQVCVIPFRRNFLLEYSNMIESDLERAESIDMNRILERGGRVIMIPTNFTTFAVDTPSDLERVSSLMRSPEFK